MATQLLVTETYIRDNTPLSQNLDIKDIVHNIGPAQDMFLQPILGSTFYNHIESAYSAQTLTTNETVLYLLIQPMLAYRAAEMSLPFIQYQIKNKGPQTQFGDNSTSVDATAFNYLRNELKNRAEFYTQRIDKYLIHNGSLFTLYQNPGTNVDMYPDLKDAYDSGFATYSSCYNNRCGGSFNGFWNTNLY